MKLPSIARGLLAVAAIGAVGAADAASLTAAGYSETFDELGTAGTAAPAGWSLFKGDGGSHTTWATTIPANGAISVASMVATSGTLTASNTPTATNINGYNAEAVKSSGALAGTSDRVLATSPTGVTGNAIQLTLTNNTGTSLTGLNLSYDIDRLTSISSSSNYEELPGYWLFYSLDGSSWTNAGSFDSTATTVPNGSKGFSTTSGTLSFASAVAAGSTFELRWVDDNGVPTSPDQIIGLNNVNIAPVPLPAALPLLLAGLGGLGMIGRRGRAV